MEHSTDKILEELNNKVIGTVDIFGQTVWITQTFLSLWVAMAIIILFCIAVRINMRKWGNKPKGLQNVAEIMVETFQGYAKSILGDELIFLGAYFFTVAIVVWLMNLSGLWLLRPGTADISTTMALAAVTFVLIHGLGIARKGKHYFKAYCEPSPLMVPLHLIGELATPISLAFRLFGSTLGGFIIIALAYALMPVFLKIGFPMVLHGYFDLFAGSLQAFIFVTLSMTFIKDKAGTEE